MDVVVASLASLLAAAAPPAADAGPAREITVVARQYGYEPHRIVADAGETLRLRLVSVDTVHGFFLEGHDLDARVFPGRLGFELRRPSRGEGYQQVEEVVVRLDRPGKYRYRCSVTCGTLHPFMQGELVVRPDRPFTAGVVGVSLIALALLGWTFLPARAAHPRRRRVDLLAAFPRLRWLVTRRGFQLALVLPNVLALVFFVAAGLLGSPIGNRNVVVTIVWILWWFLLVAVLVPLGGRVWCLVCPLPFFGEWAARRRLVSVAPPGARPRRRRWPRRLRGIWVQNFLFLAVCSFSTILVTRPALTAFVLAGLALAALVVHLAYDRRTFCRQLCPLNGWMSLYAMTAVTEVRARDGELCRACSARACVRGTGSAWACPWLEVPFRLDRNNYCGLCLECVRACPNRNLTVLLRPFCADRTIRGLDEAWMAFIMIALAIAYSVTLLGPWATVRAWANVSEVGDWAGFAIHTSAVWVGALAVVPGVWYAASWLSTRALAPGDTRQVFVRYSFMLVPLGLMAWIAFSLPLLLVNYTHVTSSLSDPLGRGWNLFGTAEQPWRPLLPETIPWVQVAALLAGLAAALWSGRAVASDVVGAGERAIRSLLPHAAVCVAITLVLLRLFAG